MMLNSLIALVLASAPALAQDVSYTAAHNVTPIIGTWSSGSQNVLTGSGFANPLNQSFNYPKTTGVSFSFTDDGYYEIARYRFNSNGTQPQCITGVMNWCHGTYTLESNGSIVMTPFGDGYQQIQDACAAVSNFIQAYNDTEMYSGWDIYLDPVLGYQLQLFEFDGTPLPPQSQVSVTPNMLPTRPLRNLTTSSSPTLKSRSDLAVNAGARTRVWSAASVTGLVSAVVAVGLGSLFL